MTDADVVSGPEAPPSPDALGALTTLSALEPLDVLEDPLAAPRRAIGSLDAQLVVLLAARAAVARRIGDEKRAHGLPIFDLGREDYVARVVAEQAVTHDLPPAEVRAVFAAIMALCRAVQHQDAPATARPGAGIAMSHGPDRLSGAVAPPIIPSATSSATSSVTSSTPHPVSPPVSRAMSQAMPHPMPQAMPHLMPHPMPHPMPHQAPQVGPVVVVGTGAIGSALLRALDVRGVPVTGVDRDPGTRVGLAREGLRMVDPADAAATRRVLSSAWTVVLALPVDGILDWLSCATSLIALIGPDTLVTDVGSTKAAILSAASAAGLGAQFVGGHPLTGSARSGWEAGLRVTFTGAPVFLCRTSETAPAMVERARSLWTLLGAEVRDARARRPEVWEVPDAREVQEVPLDARWSRSLEESGAAPQPGSSVGEGTPDGEAHDGEAHDQVLAWTSHLPQAVMTALGATLATAGVPRESLGPGGRDGTRLALSDWSVWRPILATNRTAIHAALVAFEHVVTRLREGIEEDAPLTGGRALGTMRPGETIPTTREAPTTEGAPTTPGAPTTHRAPTTHGAPTTQGAPTTGMATGAAPSLPPVSRDPAVAHAAAEGVPTPGVTPSVTPRVTPSVIPVVTTAALHDIPQDAPECEDHTRRGGARLTQVSRIFHAASAWAHAAR